MKTEKKFGAPPELRLDNYLKIVIFKIQEGEDSESISLFLRNVNFDQNEIATLLKSAEKFFIDSVQNNNPVSLNVKVGVGFFVFLIIKLILLAIAS